MLGGADDEAKVLSGFNNRSPQLMRAKTRFAALTGQEALNS